MDVTVWAGWVGGIAIGGFFLAQLWLTGKPLGVSTGYGNLCALASRAPFFTQGPYAKPVNWRLWFLVGLPLGGVVAVFTSPNATWSATLSMGALYDGVLPAAAWAKGLVLLAGGFMIGLGARMAGGCNSGHSISGMSLLNPPSFAASACFFVGGIASVQILFRLMGA